MKKKISIIDIAVVLLIVSLLFGAYYKFGYKAQTKASVQMTNLQYQILIEGVRDFTTIAYANGDEVYDSKTGTSIGKISNVETTSAYAPMTNAMGEMVIAVKPERVNVILTIDVPGVENDNSYLANGNRPINVGSKQGITTKYVNQDSEIIAVKNLNK